jgi:hypothetical protein
MDSADAPRTRFALPGPIQVTFWTRNQGLERRRHTVDLHRLAG